MSSTRLVLRREQEFPPSRKCLDPLNGQFCSVGVPDPHCGDKGGHRYGGYYNDGKV